MPTPAEQWAQSCFGGANFNDQRMTKRFVAMMSTLATNPGGRVSEVFTVPAQRQAAYDFIEHDRINSRAVQDALGDACARACAKEPCVLIVLDGTSLNIGVLSARVRDEEHGSGQALGAERSRLLAAA